MPEPKPKRFEGFVAVFYPEKFYGFITNDVPGTTRTPGIYFGARDIRPDWKGSTAHAWTPGTPVSYLLAKQPSRKYMSWIVAHDICPLFTEEPSESLETYGETSRVRTWNRCFGELLREDGDVLFFHKASVLDRFKHLLVNLAVGDYVYHGVGKRDDGRWHAVGIELFSAAEQARLQQGLPAQEPESEPEPEPDTVLAPEPTAVKPQSELLCPENKNKSLFELILGRKGKKSCTDLDQECDWGTGRNGVPFAGRSPAGSSTLDTCVHGIAHHTLSWRTKMSRKKLSLAVDLQPDGRPARELPDPLKIGPRPLGRRLLPQLPHAEPNARIRHTALPRRGSNVKA